VTCEVAILNKRGVVLAADSAGTVTQWVKGKPEVRYFKGENKIFQLSYHHPVGVMTYSNANIESTPWEIAIKEFRAKVGNSECPKLADYAEHLFEFVDNRKDFASDEQRKEALEDKVKASVVNILSEILDHAGIDAKDDDKVREEKTRRYIEKRIQQLEKEFKPELISKDEADSLRNVYSSKAASVCAKYPLYANQTNEIIEKIIAAGSLNLVVNYSKHSRYTGLVLSGYGAEDLYPHLITYKVHGFFGNRLVVEKLQEELVTHDVPSVVKSFASSDATETFFTGAGQSLYGVVNEAFIKIAVPMAADLLGIPQNNLPVDAIDKIIKAHDDFSSEWLGRAMDEHYFPFKRVVGNLPIDEMAHLGETLINLESLKERVTRPSESVGGPVDVAVITKHEGFVWIKRKHYFDLSKNPRYWQRLGGHGDD
jgi:hypothetical protein